MGNVTIGLITSMQDALTHAPRAEEIKEVTAMLGRLQYYDTHLFSFLFLYLTSCITTAVT